MAYLARSGRGIGVVQKGRHRSCSRGIGSALLIAAIFFPAWMLPADQVVSSLPDLPQIQLGLYPPGVRGELESAYYAFKANPNDAALNGNLGMVLQAYESANPGAEICYRRAHLLDHSSFRWGYYLGVVLAGEGKFTEAVSVLRDALRINPEYLPARLNLGECLLASGRWQEASDLFEALAKEDPNYPGAQFGLARVMAIRNDLNSAAKRSRRACELFPNFSAAHYELARIYERLGDREQSSKELSLYTSSHGLEPEVADPLLAEVLALNAPPSDLRRAEELEAQGKVREAVADFEKVLDENPNLEKVHVKLISLYGQLGHPEKAEEHFRAAVRLDPHDATGYYNYGLLMVSEQKYSEAESNFRKVLEINLRYPEGHTILGNMLEAQGKLAESVAEYEKAVAEAPDDPKAHFALGRMAVNQDRYEEGIQHFLISVRTGDEDERPAYLYALGAAYARAGNRESALLNLRRAREAAAARGQSNLVIAIDADLKQLEAESGPE